MTDPLHRYADYYLDPPERDFLVTVTAEHTMRIRSTSPDAAVMDMQQLMDIAIQDDFETLDGHEEVEISWIAEEPQE